MASSGNWYEAEQGVIIRRPATDDQAAEDIANGLDHGWTVLSHNVVKSPWFFVTVLFFGRLFGRAEHVITFVKHPMGS